MQLIGCCLIFTPPRQPNEIIFDEGRFLLVRSPTDQEAITFESPIGSSPNDQAGGYSSCDDQDANLQLPPQIDLTYRQAVKTREFFLVSYIPFEIICFCTNFFSSPLVMVNVCI